jgi:hypothetical protein
MTKLSDTQAVILSAAAQRDDGAVLPLPETLRIKGGAVDKVIGSLKTKGLIDHQGAPRGDNPPPLRITGAGLEAIGVEPEGEGKTAARAEADMAAAPAEAGSGADCPAPIAKTDAAGAPAKKGKGVKGKARATKAASAVKPTPRAGTRQALMIDLLKRPKGATVEQIAAAIPIHLDEGGLGHPDRAVDVAVRIDHLRAEGVAAADLALRHPHLLGHGRYTDASEGGRRAGLAEVELPAHGIDREE